MKFTDRMTIGGAKRLADGSVALTARVARGGNVQIYAGREFGDATKDVIRVYRPEAEVFRKDAIKTYAGVPVTMGHPDDMVSPETWKDVAVGEVGDDVMRDGEFVRVPMMLRDAAAIAAVEAGTRELSMGYTAHVEMQDGVSPSGEVYDAVMSNFRMNHVAVVDRARGGEELRIGDGAVNWGACPVHDAEQEIDMTLRKIVVDGLQVETTDAGAQAIEKLQGEIKAKDAAAAKAATDHAEEIAKKDTEIGTLKADLKTAQDAAKVDVDALVKARADLVAKVHAVDASIVIDGKSDADLRKAAVAAKFGDEMVADASDAEIAGMFKAATKDAETVDPVRTIISSGVQTPATDAKAYTDAQSAYVARLTRKAS